MYLILMFSVFVFSALEGENVAEKKSNVLYIIILLPISLIYMRDTL